MLAYRSWWAMVVMVAACNPQEPDLNQGFRAPTPEEMEAVLAGAGDPPRDLPPVVASRDTASLASLTFADIGRRDGVTMIGAHDEFDLAIPVNQGMTPSRLTLHLISTPRTPDATMVVRQGNRILAQRVVGDTSSRVTLPLEQVQVERGRAVVTVALYIPGQDACSAPIFYRTAVAPDSRVEYVGAAGITGGINGFFQPWLRRVIFYLPDDPSLDASQAALDAAAFVARRYRGMTTKFEIRALPEGTIPEPGSDERAIVWSPGQASAVIRTEQGRGTVLTIGTRQDSRQLFSLTEGAAMVPTGAFTGVSARLDLEGSGVMLATLDDIGVGSQTTRGGTGATAVIPFSIADFGRMTVPSSFRLIARHTALAADGAGTVAVLLNGNLIWSREIIDDSTDATISLPGRMLRRDNRLDVQYILQPREGECRFGASLFTATVDGGSAFITVPGSPMAPSFDRFPAVMAPAFSVLLEPRDRYRVELAAKAVGAMQQTTRTPLAPFVVRDLDEVKGAVLAVGTSGLPDRLDAPLVSESFRLRDLNGRVWSEFGTAENFAAMQAYERNGSDVLLLHHTGDNGRPLLDLLDDVLDPHGWFGVHGDLALRGPSGPTSLITVANSGWRIAPLDGIRTGLAARWRSGIFIAAAIVLLGFLIWLYPRVVRRELDSTG